jgi:hypothetical protein
MQKYRKQAFYSTHFCNDSYFKISFKKLKKQLKNNKRIISIKGIAEIATPIKIVEDNEIVEENEISPKQIYKLHTERS